MSDEEFDVLDELYFVHSYEHVKSELNWGDSSLRRVLAKLIEKGWVMCFRSAHEEVIPEEVDFERHYNDYLYLATKAGLLAHNVR